MIARRGSSRKARTALIGAALAVTGICADAALAPPAAAGWSAQQSAKVDAYVAKFLRSPGGAAGIAPPALSVAIGVDGALVFAQGYGEASPGRRASPQTAYHIGSLTKQFTAAAVLRLIEEGARAPLSGAPLRLETEMRDIFPGVAAWTRRDEPPITVRSLLNMTSNLPNFTRRPPPEVDPWGAVAAPRLLSALKKISPHGWPNSYEYSNTSYFLLAQIIAAARGGSAEGAAGYRDYIRAVTIDRARLHHTGFVDEALPSTEIASPHYRRRPAFAQPDWLNGSGDMTSNVMDLFAWNCALLGGRIIAPASLKVMWGDGGRVGPFTYYGAGWFVEHEDGWDRYFHTGSVPGFTSLNAILRRPDTDRWISVTLLTNADGVDGLQDLADQLVDVVRVDGASP